MTNPNNLPEIFHEGVRLLRHPDYPMFAVAEDGRLLGARGWWLNPTSRNDGYKILTYFTPDKEQRFIHLHRLVALCYVANDNVEVNIKVDHIANNPENNHYTNLRWVTARQNCQNLAKNVTGQTTSKFVGVSWKKREQRWAAQIRLEGKNKGLGQFKDELEAARAYDAALVGANLVPVNFPLSNV